MSRTATIEPGRMLPDLPPVKLSDSRCLGNAKKETIFICERGERIRFLMAFGFWANFSTLTLGADENRRANRIAKLPVRRREKGKSERRENLSFSVGYFHFISIAPRARW